MGGPPSQLGCALGSLCESVARVKKFQGAAPPEGRDVVSPEKIHLGGSMLANKTFLFVDQSSPDFFHRTGEVSLSITFLSDFGFLELFRRYSRSKSKVVKNRAKFWTVFSPSQILGGGFQKLYICYDPCLGARRMENVLWGYSH